MVKTNELRYQLRRRLAAKSKLVQNEMFVSTCEEELCNVNLCIVYVCPVRISRIGFASLPFVKYKCCNWAVTTVQISLAKPTSPRQETQPRLTVSTEHVLLSTCLRIRVWFELISSQNNSGASSQSAGQISSGHDPQWQRGEEVRHHNSYWHLELQWSATGSESKPHSDRRFFNALHPVMSIPCATSLNMKVTCRAALQAFQGIMSTYTYILYTISIYLIHISTYLSIHSSINYIYSLIQYYIVMKPASSNLARPFSRRISFRARPWIRRGRHRRRTRRRCFHRRGREQQARPPIEMFVTYKQILIIIIYTLLKTLYIYIMKRKILNDECMNE